MVWKTIVNTEVMVREQYIWIDGTIVIAGNLYRRSQCKQVCLFIYLFVFAYLIFHIYLTSGAGHPAARQTTADAC